MRFRKWNPINQTVIATLRTKVRHLEVVEPFKPRLQARRIPTYCQRLIRSTYDPILVWQQMGLVHLFSVANCDGAEKYWERKAGSGMRTR
jgi:hypothetical protein